MATTVSELQARLGVDQSSRAKFKRDMADADKSMGHLSSSGSRSFAALGRAAKVGMLAVGAAVGTGLAIAAKVGFSEFNEQQKVAAQTTSVLKSMGTQANVTAKHVEELGRTLMMKSGVDDEAIKSSENLLLTFKDIRNEVGKGNDVFDRATKSALDISVAFHKDLTSSTVMVGKALNDPIAGLTSLTRVGIQFSAKQKEVIANLVDTGRKSEAQRLILKNLEAQAGGSAEAMGKTFSGQLNILKETFRNTAGEIVGRFMPLVVSLAKVILPAVAKGLEFVADWLGKFGDAATKRGGQVRGVFEAIWGFIKENIVPIIVRLRDIAVETFHRMAKVIEDNRPALERIGERLGKLVRFLAQILLPIIKLVFQEVLPRVLAVVIFWIDKVSFVIEKQIDIYRKLLNVGQSVFNKIKGFVFDVRDAIQAAIDKVRSFFQWIKNGIDTIAGPLGKVADVFGSIKSGIGNLNPFGDGIVGAGVGAAAGAASISPTLYDDLGLGQNMGLTLTSGYRPGAITSTGNPSLHGVYPAKAIDMSGSEAAMRRFFLAEVVRGAATGLREVIHSPYWWHPGVGITAIPASAGTVLADHYNHVHVGSYDQGGYLRPGWNIAYNGLGRNEPVGFGGVTVNVSGSVIAERDLRALINKLDEDHYRRGGR